MKLPDAIIAATGIVHNCIVVTRNIADFSGVAALNTLNPLT